MGQQLLLFTTSSCVKKKAIFGYTGYTEARFLEELSWNTGLVSAAFSIITKTKNLFLVGLLTSSERKATENFFFFLHI